MCDEWEGRELQNNERHSMYFIRFTFLFLLRLLLFFLVVHFICLNSVFCACRAFCTFVSIKKKIAFIHNRRNVSAASHSKEKCSNSLLKTYLGIKKSTFFWPNYFLLASSFFFPPLPSFSLYFWTISILLITNITCSSSFSFLCSVYLHCMLVTLSYIL